MSKFFKNVLIWMNEEKGAKPGEYVLLVVLIAIIAIVVSVIAPSTAGALTLNEQDSEFELECQYDIRGILDLESYHCELPNGNVIVVELLYGQRVKASVDYMTGYWSSSADIDSMFDRAGYGAGYNMYVEPAYGESPDLDSTTGVCWQPDDSFVTLTCQISQVRDNSEVMVYIAEYDSLLHTKISVADIGWAASWFTGETRPSGVSGYIVDSHAVGVLYR